MAKNNKKNIESSLRITLFLGLILFVLFRLLFFIFTEKIIFDYLSLFFLFFSYIIFVYYLFLRDKNYFKKSLKFVIESKKFIYVGIYIFLISALIGFFAPVPLIVQEKLIEIIKELVESTRGMGCFELIRFIFFNNSFSSFNSILFGVLLGIFPIIASFFNGYLIGFVSNMVIGEAGFLSMWRLLPHGIFELPAIFISFGLGIKVGFSFFIKNESVKLNLVKALEVFILIIVPLLIIAAIIEGALIFFLS